MVDDGAGGSNVAPPKAGLSFGGIKGRSRTAVTVQQNGTATTAREAITGFGASGAKTADNAVVVAAGVRIIPKQENTFQVSCVFIYNWAADQEMDASPRYMS